MIKINTNYELNISAFDLIEAIETCGFLSDEEIIDYLLYFRNNFNVPYNIKIIDDWFRGHNRCPLCGEKLSIVSKKELHTELEGNPIENIYEQKCLKCEGEI